MGDIEVSEVQLEQTRQLRREVLRPHQAVEEMAVDEPDDAYAVGAFVSGRLLAVGLVGREGGEGAWRVRGMATAKDARGRGLGSAVLQALLAHAASEGATRVWCNARVGAVSLYERFGFEIVSEEFEVPKIGPHFRMERGADGRVAGPGGGPGPSSSGRPTWQRPPKCSPG